MMNNDLKARVSLYLKARKEGQSMGQDADRRIVIDLCAYIEFLENRNEHMARALKPFADAAGFYDPDDGSGIDLAYGHYFKIADIRQAGHSYQLSQHNPEYAASLSQPSKSGESA